jgi:hypothetical protein
MLFTSNPTRNAGPFWDAYHNAKEHWASFHVDAEEVARWHAASGLKLQGVVTLAKVEEVRSIYGESSAFYQLRVKGNFLTNESGRCIPMAIIEEAAARWASMTGSGRLTVGYDCAGPGDAGDEHVWCCVRGQKVEALHTRRGLSLDDAVAETLAILQVSRRDGERPLLNVDSSGPIGAPLSERLKDIARQRAGQPDAFECYGVHAGVKLVAVAKFERIRDRLIWCAAQWLADGGAIPPDHLLHQEMYAHTWASKPDEQLRATPKKLLKEALGRSCDRFDAFALAVFTPLEAREDTEEYVLMPTI